MDFSSEKETRVLVRWMVRRDLQDVAAIEQSVFEFPWKEDEFIRCLQQRNCIGMVAEYDNRVVGFMVYEAAKTRFHLLNIAVAPEFRRRGIARQMLQKIIGKLGNQRRNKISLEVRETNLPALFFLRSLGFLATKILRDFYENTNDDAYLMQYRLPLEERPARRELKRGLQASV
jgi:ribosomal-protein-alanine N-acetyltransferase